MAITPINTILNWFVTQAKPTQSQFWAAFRSYWHKDEMIPASSIDTLQALLDAKMDKRDAVPSNRIGTYDPAKAYIYDALSAEYVSYQNESSEDEQYRSEGFYRLREDAPAGESPETHPAHWAYQGTVMGEIVIDDVIGLTEALANKAGVEHIHQASDIEGLEEVLQPLTEAMADHEARIGAVEEALTDLPPPANYMLEVDTAPTYDAGRVKIIKYKYVSDASKKYEERFSYENGRIAFVELKDDVSAKWVRRTYSYGAAGELLLPTVADITEWSVN
jgi:hypothetical protein